MVIMVIMVTMVNMVIMGIITHQSHISPVSICWVSHWLIDWLTYITSRASCDAKKTKKNIVPLKSSNSARGPQKALKYVWTFSHTFSISAHPQTKNLLAENLVTQRQTPWQRGFEQPFGCSDIQAHCSGGRPHPVPVSLLPLHHRRHWPAAQGKSPNLDISMYVKMHCVECIFVWSLCPSISEAIPNTHFHGKQFQGLSTGVLFLKLKSMRHCCYQEKWIFCRYNAKLILTLFSCANPIAGA